ncbi:N-acetylmuramoyl-L-alanine amidase [Lysobacter sp. A378]
MTHFIRAGGSFTSPASNERRSQLVLPVYVGSNGYIQNAGIVQQPIRALEKGQLTGPHAIVLHRTVSTTAAGTLRSFQRGVGTHFLVAKDGTTYQTASLAQLTWHVGPIRSRCYQESTCQPDETRQIDDLERSESYMAIHRMEKRKEYPARYPTNGDSAGIEVVAMWTPQHGWDPTTPEQRSSIARLIEVLQSLYSLTDADVYEHDTISRKTPGEGHDLYDGDGSLPASIPPPFF